MQITLFTAIFFVVWMRWIAWVCRVFTRMQAGNLHEGNTNKDDGGEWTWRKREKNEELVDKKRRCFCLMDVVQVWEVWLFHVVILYKQFIHWTYRKMWFMVIFIVIWIWNDLQYIRIWCSLKCFYKTRLKVKLGQKLKW